MRFVLLAFFPLLVGCSSTRDEPVAGCPYCGDPVTRDAADGPAQVVPRWRLADAAWTGVERR